MKHYIYLGENPTGFDGHENLIKKNFMVALDEETNALRIEEFVKNGTLVSMPKTDFDYYQKKGLDRKRSAVKEYLEKKKVPTEEPEPKRKGRK
jgi:hypothetical protein